MRAERTAPPPGRARGLHERRQVDAAERPHGRATSACATGCSTRSIRRRAARLDGRPVPADRHRRLHPQAAPPARRRVRRDAGGDARCRPDPPRRGRVRAGGGDGGDDQGRRRRARGDRRGREPRVLVLNKADAIDADRREELGFRHPEAVLVAALDRRGARCAGGPDRAGVPQDDARPSTCCCPTPRAARLAELHEVAGDLEREETADGVRVKARLPVTVAERFERFEMRA